MLLATRTVVTPHRECSAVCEHFLTATKELKLAMGSDTHSSQRSTVSHYFLLHIMERLGLLLEAVEGGNVAALAELLDEQDHEGPRTRIVSSEMFLLHEAAKTGQIGVARWLIDHRRMSVNTFNMEGCSPLYCACNAGHVELAQLLLEHGANVNRGDRDESRTPLLYACIKGNIEIVQLLLSHGADIMAKGTAKRSL